MTAEASGGCQCGAIRYLIEGALGDAGFCHCRMCQKAFGSFGAPLVSVPLAHFRWTRGEPGIFMSSPIVERGFCHDCGTPLFMLEHGHGVIEIHMIIMAGASGLLMGHALLQPGLLSRRNALAIAARDGMRLLLGSAPGFVLAALIEGFVSPSDTIPWAGKIAAGLGTGVLMLIYLVWGARRAARQARDALRAAPPV